MMRKTLILLAFFAFATTACKDKVEGAPTEPAATPAVAGPAVADEPAPAPERRPRRITPDRIAEIEASGRTGFWSSVTEVCPGSRERAILTWNVQDPADDKYVVYVVGKDGSERNFGQGGPIGEKATGPWLRPGATFRLRTGGDKQEVAKVEIAAKADC